MDIISSSSTVSFLFLNFSFATLDFKTESEAYGWKQVTRREICCVKDR